MAAIRTPRVPSTRVRNSRLTVARRATGASASLGASLASASKAMVLLSTSTNKDFFASPLLSEVEKNITSAPVDFLNFDNPTVVFGVSATIIIPIALFAAYKGPEVSEKKNYDTPYMAYPETGTPDVPEATPVVEDKPENVKEAKSWIDNWKAKQS